MGKKWLSAVKKIFGSESKELHKSQKPMKKRGKSKNSRKTGSESYEDSAFDSSPFNKPSFPTSPLLKEAYKDEESGQQQLAYSMAMAAARAEEEAARLITTSLVFIDEESRKEVAAIKIQAAFRGYLERRGTSGLRGMVRLKSMINRTATKRYTVNTLHNLQALGRIKSQIRERRVRLSEENQALHKQRQLRHEKEVQKSKLGEDWVDSPKSKEQFEAKLQQKQEAALRRERTLAYAYSHQWRSKTNRSKNQPLVDQINPHWGWSWLDRWMATRPWETGRAVLDRDRSSDHSSIKSDRRSIAGGQRAAGKSRQSPSTPPAVASKNDFSGVIGFQSEQNRRRRHSFGGSFCFRDEETATATATAKSRFQAPDSGKLKVVNGGKQLALTVIGEREKTVLAPVATRRFSGQPKVVATY